MAWTDPMEPEDVAAAWEAPMAVGEPPTWVDSMAVGEPPAWVEPRDVTQERELGGRRQEP